MSLRPVISADPKLVLAASRRTERGAQTRDVVAYILQNNKLPAGKVELPEAEADLKQIKLATP